MVGRLRAHFGYLHRGVQRRNEYSAPKDQLGPPASEEQPTTRFGARPGFGACLGNLVDTIHPHAVQRGILSPPRLPPDLIVLDHRQLLRHVAGEQVVDAGASSGFSGNAEKVRTVLETVLGDAFLDPRSEAVLVPQPRMKGPGVEPRLPLMFDWRERCAAVWPLADLSAGPAVPRRASL